MKESNTRNIKIIYRGSTSAEKESRTWKMDDDRKSSSDRVREEGGSAFESRLDYRDEMIHVPFTFSINKAAYLANPASYQEEILEWLVNAVENIFSITFRCLLEERLSTEEGKAFACKNILLNIKELCEYLHAEVGAPVDEHFLKQLDSHLTEIISIVINKYPQNNAKTASKKVLRFIKQISNRENDQYDFLFTHGLSIKYRTNGDYSSEIMQVINQLLNAPLSDVREDEALIDNFRKFCRQLFYYAREETGSLRESATFKIVDDSIDIILNSDSPNRAGGISVEQLDELNQHRTRIDNFKDVAAALASENYEITEDLLSFEKAKAQLFKIGQKIPSEVKQFSEREIKEGQFKVYHASVLRVLTKWSEELYSKLERADELIRSRIHKFKTNSDSLRFCSVEQKECLYQEALKEKLRVDEYLQTLKDENNVLQSSFAAEKVSGKFIKKFTSVDVFAGKLEEMVAHYTFRYLNRLIHSLLSISISAGEKLYENYKYLENLEDLAEKYLKELGEINLVTFKVGDLLRARYSCLEHEFVNTLGILYKIEELDSSFLRIIKIKNRMFEKDNDILINLFFKNRTICELQLSIHREENKKEKLYGEFNHFIYELKRSEFGIISEFSSIIAQHDPIVNYFTFFQHKPPVVIEKSKKHSLYLHSRSKELLFRRKISDGSFINHKLYEKAIERPFICERCKTLKTVLNPKFYYREETELFCNDCIEQYLYKQPEAYTNILKDLFKYYILDEHLEPFLQQISLWNHMHELRNIRVEKQLYVEFIDYGFAIEKGDKNPKVRFFKTFYNPMSNSVVLSSMVNGEVDNFLYLDCKKEKNQYLLFATLEKYLFFDLKSYNEEEMEQMAQTFISEENCECDFINTVHIKEKEFLKKEYIKAILNSFEKYHTTLYLNGYKYIIEYIYEYLHGTNEQRTSKRRSYFENNAHRVSNLLLESSEIFTIYPFITYFVNLRELNLSSNHIKSVQILQSFKQLQSLTLSRNHIATIEPLNKMPWLETIIAKKNEIETLTGIHQIKSLKVLDCSENKITAIKDLEGLGSLEELILAKNTIGSMEGISHLYKLRVLTLSDNGISKIEYLSGLKLLESVDLSFNFIGEMVAFENLGRLENLNISNNTIKQIVQVEARSVKELNLSANLIAHIENLSDLAELTHLNLAKNKIELIVGLESLEKLKRLTLNDNRIRTIENLEALKNLEYFKIENNPICAIRNINSLKSLGTLSLEHCDLTVISEVSSLKKLRSLTLAHNSIARIINIDELVRLQKLDLSCNRIEKIENLSTLKYLQNLSLSNNRIAKMENLEQLLELNWLVLSKNRISRIEGLDTLTELRALELEHNDIEKIEGLDFLVELEELILSSNKIQKISNLDFQLSLKKLSLANNKIAVIDGLNLLGMLELLDLQMNNIEKIQNLNALRELKWLVLSINRIQKIEGLEKLEQLSKLILSHNSIFHIENLSQLKVLSVLYIDNNIVDKIEGLEELQNLEKLNLSHNNICKIEGLEKLSYLNELNLEENSIGKIENLESLVKLKKLTLARNDLKVIENVEILKELTYLEVSGNQISEITNIHNLPYLEYFNLADNPVNNIEAYSLLNEHVKLCLEVIMHKFDSENLKRTNHQAALESNFSPQKKDDRGSELEDKEGGKIKLIRSFAKAFSPNF